MVRRLFLERRTYRQNRLQDAARLVPFLGAILIFGPIFIREEGEAAPTLAGGLVYYFAIWLGLIVLTAALSRALNASAAPDLVTEPAPEPAPQPEPHGDAARTALKDPVAAPGKRG